MMLTRANSALLPVNFGVRFGGVPKIKDFPELGGKGTLYDNIVILDGRRTPMGAHMGALSDVNETDLAIAAAKGTIEAAGISPEKIKDSLWGNVMQSSTEAAYLSRNVMLAIGAPVGTVATTLNKLCGSGLKAIETAAKEIGLMEDASVDNVILAGGTESMSNAPFSSFALIKTFSNLGAELKKLQKPNFLETLVGLVNTKQAATLVKARVKKAASKNQDKLVLAFQRDLEMLYLGKQPKDPNAFRNTLRDGLTHKRINHAMIDTAENLRERFHLTPEQLDNFSVESQHRAARAIDAGKLMDEIVPVLDENGKVILAQDEGVRGMSVKAESLAGLRKNQARNGSEIHMNPEKAVHTAANASRIVDGAAAVLVTNVETAERLNKKPLGKLLATSEVGVNPKEMGYGAAQAAKAALRTAGLTLQDIDLVEINEAFAGVGLATGIDLAQEYGMDLTELLSKTNVNGGAIALGHPLGATGTRLPITVLKELKRQNLRYGLIAACVGGGQGVAGVVENPDAPKKADSKQTNKA